MRPIYTFIFLLAVASMTAAQSPSQTGLDPTLPIVPSPTERTLNNEEHNFNADPRDPVARLVDSVTQSDAIIEVVNGHGRIITTKSPIASEGGLALVAAGDPTVLDFDVAGPRMIRVLGKRVGVSDLTVTTDDGSTYSFDVHVVYDVPLIRAYLQQLYPDATIKISQLREHIVLEGQARSAAQLTQIVDTLQVHLLSLQPETTVTGGGAPQLPQEEPGGAPIPPDAEQPPEAPGGGPSPINIPDVRPKTETTYPVAQIINLMTVPGVQQVMLKVQVAELNRTALRRIGADIFVSDSAGEGFTTNLGNSLFSTVDVFPSSDVALFVNALRSNSVLNILAEPTLVALHGQEASFIAGGEFPFPVPQSSGGINTTITIQFKPFGVQLNFVPYLLDDNTIRLRVAPEVSELNFATGTSLGGTIVPGINTRAVNTTVELSQGQTLAIGGLLQVTLDANTRRIPGLGDLPYIGVMFSNTSHQRVEKELVVLVTPYLVSPMDANQKVCLPGEEILDPNDCEFYFLNRIEGRTGQPFRATTSWDNPLGLVQKLELESRGACGPAGYSE